MAEGGGSGEDQHRKGVAGPPGRWGALRPLTAAAGDHQDHHDRGDDDRPGHAEAGRNTMAAHGTQGTLARSAVDESLEVLGVAGSLDLDLGGSAFDLAQVVEG